jgi:peptide/nickel transport system permease protein
LSIALGALIVGIILFVGLFAPWLTSADPEAMDMNNRLSGPSRSHWLGTDNFGRDLWTRSAYGARISLTIALTSVGVAAVFGTMVGLAAGYLGGWIDIMLMRVVDLFLGFPPLILALALVAALGPGTVQVIIALIAVFWTEYARVVRAITLSEAEREYVAAARAIGSSTGRILFREILPNTLGPVIVLATLGMGTAIVAESGLSFLGFGVQPPTPTWGWTLAYGMRFLRSHIWLSTVPGLFIMVTVLGFNLFGDGLRDALDPRDTLRQARTPGGDSDPDLESSALMEAAS